MEEDRHWIDAAVDVVWNLIFISARVITLALFASYQITWFWGLIIAQMVVVAIIISSLFHRNTDDEHSVFYRLFASCFSGIGMVFNMFSAHPIPVKFYVYLVYWAFMFIEDTVMISLWYTWTESLGLWYHDVAIGCVIPAHIVALVIKSVQCYFYNEQEVRWDWKF